MAYLFHQLATARHADSPALLLGNETLSYGDLARRVRRFADALQVRGLARGDRVAIYLPKRFETIVAMFGTTAAGGVVVPINPALRAAQVEHILTDSGSRVLVTSSNRAVGLGHMLAARPVLEWVITTGHGAGPLGLAPRQARVDWAAMIEEANPGHPPATVIDQDLAAILYTSGSTGRAKGVMLSHRNLVAGAECVAEYLGNRRDDRLLAVLPLSFDYGLNQITSAFLVGASVVLIDYLLPRDVIRAVARYRVTGLAAVPALWNVLAALPWPAATVASLRYLTSSGGVMPVTTTARLVAALPRTEIFLMYGLTESFRSTFLAPGQVGQRPDSIGKAVPNAELMVVGADGHECAARETGELVHRGALVALGYWGDPAATAARFRPWPGKAIDSATPDRAVWSGDRVWRDADGYHYFVGRADELIKTSGYRVSPTEVEEVVMQLEGIEQVAAFGVQHPEIGQGIVVVVKADTPGIDGDSIARHCKARLPGFMLPSLIRVRPALPYSANGKVDRALLRREFAEVFVRPGGAA